MDGLRLRIRAQRAVEDVARLRGSARRRAARGRARGCGRAATIAPHLARLLLDGAADEPGTAAFRSGTSPRSTKPGCEPSALPANVVPERGEPTTKTIRFSRARSAGAAARASATRPAVSATAAAQAAPADGAYARPERSESVARRKPEPLRDVSRAEPSQLRRARESECLGLYWPTYMANETINEPISDSARRPRLEEGVWTTGPERRADPGLRVDLPDDQRRGSRPRHRRPRGQGRGARRHRLQVRRRHPRQRAFDPPLGESGGRGLSRRRDRRARDDQGGRRRPADPLEEARALRDRLEGDRAGARAGRARHRARHRGRQGRPDPRPRRARLPARVAGRHPPRPGSRRVPRTGASLAR